MKAVIVDRDGQEITLEKCQSIRVIHEDLCIREDETDRLDIKSDAFKDGVAVANFHFHHSPERISIDLVVDGKIAESRCNTIEEIKEAYVEEEPAI